MWVVEAARLAWEAASRSPLYGAAAVRKGGFRAREHRVLRARSAATAAERRYCGNRLVWIPTESPGESARPPVSATATNSMVKFSGLLQGRTTA